MSVIRPSFPHSLQHKLSLKHPTTRTQGERPPSAVALPPGCMADDPAPSSLPVPLLPPSNQGSTPRPALQSPPPATEPTTPEQQQPPPPSPVPISPSPPLQQQVHAMEAQLLKFKRLLTMSRERLEENQRQLSDKNQTIDRLTREVDTIKSKLSRSQTQTTEQTQAAAAAIAALKQLQQQQQQQQHQKNQQQKHQQQRQQRERGEEKMGDPPVAVEVPPRRALLRVQQDNLIWVLFEKDEPPKGSSSSSSNSSNGDKHHSLGLAWKSFACEEDLAGHIARGPGQEPLLLPSPCLSPQQSTRLSLEAQGRVDQLQEELRYVLHLLFFPSSLLPSPSPPCLPADECVCVVYVLNLCSSCSSSSC